MESVTEILRLQALQLLEILPALLKAGIIFLVGYIIARILYQILRRVLAAIGLDRLAERLLSIDFFQNAKINLVPSKIIANIVYYFVMIVFVMAAVEALGMTMISNLMMDLIDYIPNAITAFVILVFGIFLADQVKKIVLSACRSLGITAGNLIANAIFYFILLNIVLIALSQAQLQTAFMENNISIILGGVAGAFAIGYGMASRHIMGNMLSSFYNRNRVRIGDEITITDKRGEVTQMNNVSLTIRNEDSEYIIPFSKLSSDGVQIHSRRQQGPPLPPNQG